MNVERGRALYFLTIGGSALLLFLVQPVMAKALLPRFGGSAGVWVTAMLFFQTVLLLGYLYSFTVTRLLSRKTQSAVHAALLALSLAILPVTPRFDRAPQGGMPEWSILAILAASVGLPYFLLSTTSPLLQSWYAGSYTAAFPYRLFALSNGASVAALVSYPFLIEPVLGVSEQLRWWSAGYVGIAALAAATAFVHGVGREVKESPAEKSEEARPLLWIGLAACASVLWLSAANHLSQNTAPVPFLWVLPLGIYLFSFVVCFEKRSWYRPWLFRWLLPAAWLTASYRIARPEAWGGLRAEIAVFAGALAVWCIFCHGELARSKPASRGTLTYFYLMVALGGALGGAFVGLAAPILFRTYLELQIGIVASVLLALPLLYGVRSRMRMLRIAALSAAALVAAAHVRSGTGKGVEARNFYGAVRVSDLGSGEMAYRALHHGRTLHGGQFLSPARSGLATAYYGPESGVGRLLSASEDRSRRIGVVGLGAGTLASYGRKGDRFRFYEINPAVVKIATRDFQFLAKSAAERDVVVLDGRLGLEREPPGSFDVLVLDAFSDDSIPVHLLTTEAFELYFRLLHKDGILAIHVTNRYLDLGPLVEALAASIGKRAIVERSPPDPERRILAAEWALVSAGSPAQQVTVRPWTDDYSNLAQLLK
ncbi:MAG: spermidine synthase [Bryobacteraceae bacterium]